MIILGLNGIDGIFHDASATIIVDGKIIASVEEERFNRKKHSNGVPINAIKYCLHAASVTFEQIDAVGYYLDPDVLEKTFVDDMVEHYGANRSDLQYMVETSDRIRNLSQKLAEHFSVSQKTEFHFLNHHVCHAASAFYVSGYDDAAVLTIDGSGDHESASLFHGTQQGLERITNFTTYPVSLGFIYTSFSHHLGLGWIEGPGKLMGLAAYGKSDTSLFFDDIIKLKQDSHTPVEIDLSYFQYHLGNGDFPQKTIDRFGPARQPDDPYEQKHFDLAATVQDVTCITLMHIAKQVPKLLPKNKNLCYAGGLALNVITNRLLKDCGLFDGVFVTPPAYDGGCSLGAALHLSHKYEGFIKREAFNPYLGPNIEKDHVIEDAIKRYADQIEAELLSEEDLPLQAAKDLAATGKQKIIGWAQGRMECGPRALGNRSILMSPIPKDSKDQINTRVKKREHFRPYGPSVLEEFAHDWFDIKYSPYMLMEAMVHKDKREHIPGVVHVNGSSRPQTVRKDMNPRYHSLISAFQNLTGVPVVLNTSFNRHGEPIVNTPDVAIMVLLETDMDALYVGRWRITKKAAH